MKKITIALLMTMLVMTSMNVTAHAEEEMPDRMYSVVTDRFYNFVSSNDEGVSGGDSRYPFGGDFRGIINYIDYIDELGLNTIHVSPVFNHDTDDYLGYAVVDYDIASAFGGHEDFTALLEEAHARDMKVVVDFPLTIGQSFEGNTELSTTDDVLTSDLQAEYFDLYDVDAIDMTNDDNTEYIREVLSEFVDAYPVDGVSFFIVQDGIDGSAFIPEGITSYAIATQPDLTVSGFDHVATDEIRQDVAHSFHYFDNEIFEYPEDYEPLLLADHWFSERFTYESVELRAFPGTRVQQLSIYLLGYPGPMSYYYGTEIAQNGNTLETIHPQMNFWTDTEAYDHMKVSSEVFGRFPKMYEGEIETLLNESGHYVVRYHTAEDEADFILRINDSSSTRGFSMSTDEVGESMMLSGVLTGEIARSNSDSNYITVLDRETSDLFAIIDNVGLNYWYLLASVLIFGGFVLFLYVVAKRRPATNVK